MKQRFMLFTLTLSVLYPIYAQDIKVKGNLSDSKGNPIPFANIYLETNTEVGTLTDYDGNYELIIKEDRLNGQGKFTLVLSVLGFRVRKVDLDKKSEIELSIVLEDEAQILGEVILSSESNASKEYTVLKLDKIDIYIIIKQYCSSKSFSSNVMS